MKRILIFSLAYYPHVGGAEVAIKEITDRIAPEDIEFHMVTLRFSAAQAKEERIGNVQIHRVGFGGVYLSKIFFVPIAALAGRRLSRQYRFDGAWAMMSYMTFPLTLMRLFSLQSPYVLTLQEGDPFEFVFKRWYIRIFSPLLKYGFRHARVIQAISAFLADWAKRTNYKGTIEVIPNGVDTQKFVGVQVPHSGTVLITTSRLVYKNAIDDVIRALAFLPHEVSFQILGLGVDESKLKELAQKEGVANRVQFSGHVDHKDMPAYLHKADIFIRPSRSEGIGNSFIEAFAAGLPVIATQEGGIADFLFDKDRNPDKEATGWAVDADSPLQIALQVKEILGNPARAAVVVERAKKLASEKYDWDLIAKNMREKVFARLFI